MISTTHVGKPARGEKALRRNTEEGAPLGGETRQVDGSRAAHFSFLSAGRDQVNRWKQKVYARSQGYKLAFTQLRSQIDFGRLSKAKTEKDVDDALAKLHPVDRSRLPSSAAILAAVRDPKYPKIRPLTFIASSCALDGFTKRSTGEPYAPRYSRDLVAEERSKHRDDPKPLTGLRYWRAQAEAGQTVPEVWRRRLKRRSRKKSQEFPPAKERMLTYVNISKTIKPVKKRRTTVWLPENLIERLKKLSDKTGAPMAELLRRAVEAYLKRKFEKT